MVRAVPRRHSAQAAGAVGLVCDDMVGSAVPSSDAGAWDDDGFRRGVHGCCRGVGSGVIRIAGVGHGRHRRGGCGQVSSRSAEGAIVRFFRAAVPFRAVAADDGEGDLYQPVDVAGLVRGGLDGLERPSEHAAEGVSAKGRVEGQPRTVASRQVTSGDVGADRVDHPVDDLSVLHSRTSRGGPRYQRRE